MPAYLEPCFFCASTRCIMRQGTSELVERPDETGEEVCFLEGLLISGLWLVALFLIEVLDMGRHG